MGVFFDPDANFDGMFQAFCDKCARYYNPRTPHVCHPDGINLEHERGKLRRWLDNTRRGYKTIE